MTEAEAPAPPDVGRLAEKRRPVASEVPKEGSRTAIGGPVKVAWREGTLARAHELESLARWSRRPAGEDPTDNPHVVEQFEADLRAHLAAAREAAENGPPGRRRTSSRLERAISNIDSAEADLLQLASADYLLGQLTNILNHVQRHLKAGDPRRVEVEWIVERLKPANAQELGVDGFEAREEVRRREVRAYRHTLVSNFRSASSVALREQTRVRSFRNVLVVATAGMTLVLAALIIVGAVRPTAIPLCFAPQDGGRFIVVCPMQQSPSMEVETATMTNEADIDALTSDTTTGFDISLVAIVGLTAAAVAAAAAIRSIRGSSEPYGVPLALAILKLPTGAVTAVLGLVLMRGQFIPGLSALDSSAQILAWAAIFGYAQQLFTRLVDQQAHAVLDGVRGGDKNLEASRST